MRFEELVLRIPGDEFRIRFHEHLTVLSGVGMLERQALADSFLGALTGAAESTVLTMHDGVGRPIQVVSAGGRAEAVYTDDNTPAPPAIGGLVSDADALRALMLLQAGDLGLNATRSRADDPPELAEARSSLATLTSELQAAIGGRQSLDAAREELGKVDQQIRQASDGTAEREYARILADLERVRSEAAALQSGNTGVETDRHLMASAPDAHALAEQWRVDAAHLAEMLAAFGDQPRLDPDTLAQVRFVPDAPPSELGRMLADLETTRHERDVLDGRLRGLAKSRLPDPSDPRVVDLATVGQNELWAARQHVIEAARRLRDEQVAMGGADSGTEAADFGSAALVKEIEAAHSAVEAAEHVMQRRAIPTAAGGGIASVVCLLAVVGAPLLAIPAAAGAGVAALLGLVAPRRSLNRARRKENAVLSKVGAPTYLSFHMRRVDAVIDPSSRDRIEAVAMEHRLAATAWAELGRGISTDDAAALETEVRAYAAALAGMGGAADEIEQLRADLTDHAEPAVVAARRALVNACAAYGLDSAAVDTEDGSLVERLLAQQVAIGRLARLQDALEDAEKNEEKVAGALDDLLHQLGFREGGLDARIGALEWAADRAREREEARARARSRTEIEDDLEHLQAEARRLRRPEWASVTPLDAKEPDLETLTQRRDELQAALASNPGSAIDVDRLADRHSAAERRVAALESRLGAGTSESTIAQLADVHQYLLAHLTQAAHVGPRDETVPVLLDEVFLRVPAERKWELLDMLRRMGEKTQLVYLTDDPFVTAWSRRRAAAGLITLLEPVAEPV